MNLCHRMKKVLWPASRNNRLRRRDYYAAPCVAQVELLEQRQLLSSVAISTAGGSIVLQAADNGDHTVTLTRINANTIQVAGANGTQLTLNGSGAAAQKNLNIGQVTGITINGGKGLESFTIQDISVQGNIIFNGDLGAPVQGGGSLKIQATTADVVISGLIIANYGNEQSDFELHANTGNLTVNGKIFVHSNKGAGTTLFADIDSNNGHKAWLKSGLNIWSNESASTVYVNSYKAQSQTVVDGGVYATMSGDISFTGDHTGSVTVNGAVTVAGGLGDDYLGVYANSHLTGPVLFMALGTDVFESVASLQLYGSTQAPVLDGPVTILASGKANNIINIQSYDPLHPITFSSSFTALSGNGSDEFIATNVNFLGALTVVQGSTSSPNALHDSVVINGTVVGGPALFSSQGHTVDIKIADASQDPSRPTVFKSTVVILATGPNSTLKISNGNPGIPVHFKGALVVIGGWPNKAQLTTLGNVEVNPLLVTLINVNGSL